MTISERVDAIELRLAVHKAGLDYPNLAMLKNHIIENDDDALMTQLEDAYAEFLNEKVEADEKIEVEIIGEKVRKACDKALNIVIGTNIKTGKSREDRQQMKATYADVLEELKGYELGEAIKQIKILPTDGYYVTLKLKAHVLEILEGALL